MKQLINRNVLILLDSQGDELPCGFLRNAVSIVFPTLASVL